MLFRAEFAQITPTDVSHLASVLTDCVSVIQRRLPSATKRAYLMVTIQVLSEHAIVQLAKAMEGAFEADNGASLQTAFMSHLIDHASLMLSEQVTPAALQASPRARPSIHFVDLLFFLKALHEHAEVTLNVVDVLWNYTDPQKFADVLPLPVSFDCPTLTGGCLVLPGLSE